MCRVNDVVTLLSLKATDVLTLLGARCLEPCQLGVRPDGVNCRLSYETADL